MATTGTIQLKRGTSAQWGASGIPLLPGEVGVQLDPTAGPRIKIGDGSTLFPDLPWATPDSGTLDRLEQLAIDIDSSLGVSAAEMAAVLADKTSTFYKNLIAEFVARFVPRDQVRIPLESFLTPGQTMPNHGTLDPVNAARDLMQYAINECNRLYMLDGVVRIIEPPDGVFAISSRLTIPPRWWVRYPGPRDEDDEVPRAG